MQSVPIRDGHLEISDMGSGEPVVFIQTALVANESVPLSSSRWISEYRRILYHRRGYGESSPAATQASISGDVADCVVLLDQLEIARAHVVGLSYSGAVALQLAASFPDRAQSLVLIEPPPTLTPSEPEFRSTSERLLETRRESGAAVALEEIMQLLAGRGWRDRFDALLDGSPEQMERDARTFFDVDLPSLLEWEFGTDDAARVGCPVLYVGGSESGVWFEQVRDVITRWFPNAETVTVEGADHSLALTHPDEIAGAMAAFFFRHPLDARAR